MEAELGWETFALTSTCTCNALFDNVIVTDETTASAVVVQPSSPLQYWFIWLLGIIGAAMGLLAGVVVMSFIQKKRPKHDST